MTTRLAPGRLGWLSRPVAPASWDALLWGSAAVAIGAIAAAQLVPQVADLAILFALTLFLNGPYGAFLPALQEPVLMVFARLHHPALVSLVTVLSVTAVEIVNYRLFGAALHARFATPVRESRLMARVVPWFRRAAFLTTAVVALSPLPFWAVRIVAAVDRYPTWRFVLANAVGRFPRYWAYAALGLVIPIGSRELLLGALAVSLTLAVVLWRRRKLLRGMPRDHVIVSQSGDI